MSPLRCTGMKSSPTSSSAEWLCSGKNTVDSVFLGGEGGEEEGENECEESEEQEGKGNDM